MWSECTAQWSVHLGFQLLQGKASPHWTSWFEINSVQCEISTRIDCWSQWARFLTDSRDVCCDMKQQHRQSLDRVISKIIRSCYFFCYCPPFSLSLCTSLGSRNFFLKLKHFKLLCCFCIFWSQERTSKEFLSANFSTKFPCCLPSELSEYSQSSS